MISETAAGIKNVIRGFGSEELDQSLVVEGLNLGAINSFASNSLVDIFFLFSLLIPELFPLRVLVVGRLIDQPFTTPRGRTLATFLERPA